MKCFLFFAAIGLAIGFGSCAKLSSCRAVDSKCLQRPPVNEACQSSFSRWFYDADADQCTLVSYTGCSDFGFKSEEECNACVCNK